LNVSCRPWTPGVSTLGSKGILRTRAREETTGILKKRVLNVIICA